jgi:hypothetical protein
VWKAFEGGEGVSTCSLTEESDAARRWKVQIPRDFLEFKVVVYKVSSN